MGCGQTLEFKFLYNTYRALLLDCIHFVHCGLALIGLSEDKKKTPHLSFNATQFCIGLLQHV